MCCALAGVSPSMVFACGQDVLCIGFSRTPVFSTPGLSFVPFGKKLRGHLCPVVLFCVLFPTLVFHFGSLQLLMPHATDFGSLN